jgi:hypothetical protein
MIGTKAFEDTWANHTEKDFSNTQLPLGSNFYDNKSKTNENAIVDAYTNTDAMKALKQDSQMFNSNPNKRFLRLNDVDSKFKKTNPNILPQSIRQDHFVDEFFLGNSNVETMEEAGEMTDRLGNKFKIMHSKFPPAQKKHHVVSDGVGERRLEKMGVFTKERVKKTEVVGTVNPAEPSKITQTSKIHKNTLEMNNRDTFLNKNGLQPAADFETNRSMYDGHNLKAGHETRAAPLVHQWRAQTGKQSAQFKSSNEPEKNISTGLASKKKEISGIFPVVNANAVSISAKNSNLTVPVLSEANFRSNVLEESYKNLHGIESQAILSEQDHDITMRSTYKTMEPKKTQENVIKPAVKSNLDHLNELRQNGAIEPKPTKEFDAIRKIAEEFDHSKEDDKELLEIYNSANQTVSAGKLHEAHDHYFDSSVQIKPELVQQNDLVLPGNYMKSQQTISHTDRIDGEQPIMSQEISAKANQVMGNVHVKEADRTYHSRENTRDLSLLGMRQEETVTLEKERNTSDQPTIPHNGSFFAPEMNPTIRIDDNNRQQNMKINTNNDQNFTYASIQNVQVGDTNRQNETDRVNSDSNFAFSPIQNVQVSDTNRQNETDRVNPDSNVAYSSIQNVQVGDTNRQNETDRVNPDSNVAYSSIQNVQVSDTNRQNETDRVNADNLIVQSAVPHAKITLPQEDRAIFGRVANPSSLVTQKQMKANVRPKTSPENMTYARTNGAVSQFPTNIRSNVDHSKVVGGTTVIDRLHHPHEQNRLKIDKIVEQSNHFKDDRSTPMRTPSRVGNTQPRMIPMMQQSNVRSETMYRTQTPHNARHTPMLFGRMSRNE